ncbi:hypothetical protein DL546_002776 [Coniochaeta pulveracea]|uniref:WW domain-containing protein n=1 Tax=Coniochaeta pulveracea TaxID=177199 RepID=A0A420Y4P0_9PEZI|nr:hypothetical protein DL546_002776 [Coniochaeta pulveracea]
MSTPAQDDQLNGTKPKEDPADALAPGLPDMNDGDKQPAGRDGKGLSNRNSTMDRQDPNGGRHEVDMETSSAHKTQVESQEERSRSSSLASSVTSPTSSEINESTYGSITAAKEQPEPGAQATSAPPLPSEPIPGTQAASAPPLPSEPLPGTEKSTPAPLPSEPAPAQEDDGWEYHWNASTNSYWFYNRYTQVWSAENPRLAPAATSYAPGVPQPSAPTPTVVAGQVISDPTSLSGGYNPAIHGDYDPNAWYAQAARSLEEQTAEQQAAALNPEYATAGFFNRHTGQWQQPEQGPERHSDEAKSKRQLNNFFDVDAAANEHDGRSLRAERAGKKPTKAELKAYKEKRRARKEEKRRAWLRD